MHTISEDTSILDFDLNGGRISKLVLDGHAILGTFTRIDGKQGNTHICAPNFGSEGVDLYGLPAHGPGRNSVWKMEKNTNNSLTVSYDMPETGSYPTTLSIIQIIALKKKSLTHTIQLINTGSKNAPVNCAIHYYFHTPEGWEQLSINGNNCASLIKNDSSMKGQDRNTILIPGIVPVSIINQNLSRLHVWTGRMEQNNTISYDQTYCCIEPVCGENDYFGSEESMLKPKQSREYSCTIAV